MEAKTLEQTVFEIESVMLHEPIALNDKLQRIIPILSGHLKAAKCSIMLINHDEMTLEVRAATNPEIIGFSRKLSDVTISTRAIIDGRPFHVGSSKRSFFDPLDSSRYKTDYSLSVPLKHLDRKLGVINFTDFECDGEIDDNLIEERAVAVIQHLAAYLYSALDREQLEARVGKLEKAVIELNRLNEMKSDLTNYLIRELKGPISTIVANLDMIGYDPLTPEQAECLNLATEDVYRMQNMVMDMLDVMRMEEGDIAVYRADADIKALVEREAAAFANMLSRRNIKLNIDVDPRLCYIDESLIGRVIVNMILNAISRTADGGSISISASYDEEIRETVISVSDDGCGVPSDMRDQIFEKSWAESGGSGAIGGGMGLTFCKLIIEAHGGRIWVEGSELGGARFSFSLPETLKRRN